MSRTISLREASRSLHELLILASRGEEVIIAAEDGPAARLVPYATSGTKHPRVFGKYRGKIRIRDDFDAPLPESFWLGRDSR